MSLTLTVCHLGDSELGSTHFRTAFQNDVYTFVLKRKQITTVYRDRIN